VTLAFVDDMYFLTMFQQVLPLHECATKSAADPLHSIATPATASAAPTETSCICV
jgi:hypothetical protein